MVQFTTSDDGAIYDSSQLSHNRYIRFVSQPFCIHRLVLLAETISNDVIHSFHSPSASSVLQNNGKLYGAINALEDSDYKCWNSDPGDNQFYVIKFGRPVIVVQLKIQFQAGFSSEFISVQTPSEDGNWDTVDEMEPRDTLGIQVFVLDKPTECRELRLDFVDFKDFYGRITVYKIQAWGSEVN